MNCSLSVSCPILSFNFLLFFSQDEINTLIKCILQSLMYLLLSFNLCRAALHLYKLEFIKILRHPYTLSHTALKHIQQPLFPFSRSASSTFKTLSYSFVILIDSYKWHFPVHQRWWMSLRNLVFVSIKPKPCCSNNPRAERREKTSWPWSTVSDWNEDDGVSKRELYKRNYELCMNNEKCRILREIDSKLNTKFIHKTTKQMLLWHAQLIIL